MVKINSLSDSIKKSSLIILSIKSFEYPRILFIGGVHGNEPAGSYALNKIIEDYNNNKFKIKKGTLIILPNINKFGLLFNSRYNFSLKNRDINRNFLKNPKGFHANFIRNYSKQADIVIDLHEGFSYNKIFPSSVGSTIIHNSINNPNFLYIGSEVYINGLAKVLKFITQFNIDNIKLCGLNFSYLLKSIKSETIDEIIVINPDPWPKKRHNKRRLLSHKNLVLMKKKLKKRGKIFISTDSKNYFDDIKLIVNNEKQFDKVIFECMSNLDNMYGISNYQRKAISNKKEIYKIEITHN